MVFEVAGRWSATTVTFLQNLAWFKSLSVPSVLTQLLFFQCWTALLACSIQRARVIWTVLSECVRHEIALSCGGCVVIVLHSACPKKVCTQLKQPDLTDIAAGEMWKASGWVLEGPKCSNLCSIARYLMEEMWCRSNRSAWGMRVVGAWSQRCRVGYGNVGMGGKKRETAEEKAEMTYFKMPFGENVKRAVTQKKKTKQEPKGIGGKERRQLPPERLGGESKRCHSHLGYHWGPAWRL